MARADVVAGSTGSVPTALLKTAIEWQPEAICIMDQSLRIVAVNTAWMSEMGIGPEAVGRTIPELMGDVGEQADKQLRDVLAGTELIRTFETPEGGEFRQVTMSPWRDENGEICGVVTRGTVTDCSLNSLEGRERRLRAAMNIAKAESFQVDFRTGVVTYDPPRPSVTDDLRFYSHEDLVVGLPEEEHQKAREAWEAHLVTGKPMVREYQIPGPDGGLLWQTTVSEAVRDLHNQALGIIGVRQITDDRKKAELALLAEKEAAQAADRSKSEFLANMSHEIRTPLNGVLGLASLLRQTPLEPAQYEMVQTIETSAQTLNALLSDVLDLAKIEAGHLELDIQPFDPAEVASHIHHLFAGAAAAKHLTFSCDIDPSVEGLVVGDRTRLSQILTNLTSNAIKFTASGAVALRVWASGEGDDQQLSFAIADTGVGISGEALSRLFERFVQADGSISRSFGGTGLGLAISRTLARMMGGDVVAASEAGKGSTFTVTIRAPRWGQDAGEATAEDVAVISALPLDRLAQVLLVEDHPVNRRVVELILGDLVSLECAENGALGLAAFKQRSFDVVLMDMQMPVMDGLEATRAIRAFERQTAAAPTPIIMLSANALSEHVRKGLDAGADFHLAKPITADQLVQAVARAMEAPDADAGGSCAAAG